PAARRKNHGARLPAVVRLRKSKSSRFRLTRDGRGKPAPAIERKAGACNPYNPPHADALQGAHRAGRPRVVGWNRDRLLAHRVPARTGRLLARRGRIPALRDRAPDDGTVGTESSREASRRAAAARNQSIVAAFG